MPKTAQEQLQVLVKGTKQIKKWRKESHPRFEKGTPPDWLMEADPTVVWLGKTPLQVNDRFVYHWVGLTDRDVRPELIVYPVE